MEHNKLAKKLTLSQLFKAASETERLITFFITVGQRIQRKEVKNSHRQSVLRSKGPFALLFYNIISFSSNQCGLCYQTLIATSTKEALFPYKGATGYSF